MSPIESAVSYETAIEIIPENVVNKGIFFLRRALIDLVQNLEIDSREVTVIPIEEGGHDVGQYLCEPGEGIHLTPNPMQMSHYGDKNEYLGTPLCKSDPDLRLI
jgi:hypothetical protein